MKTAVEILEGAKGRVERGWTQRFLARSKDGREVEPRDPRASQWCAYGAICAEYEEYYDIGGAEKLLLSVLGTGAVGPWNDEPGRTQEEVLEAFDKAITLAKERNEHTT